MGNYLTENKAKQNTVCANCYDSQQLKRAINNQNSISEADNSLKPSPSLSCSIRKVNS